jgi:hypothetical protein
MHIIMTTTARCSCPTKRNRSGLVRGNVYLVTTKADGFLMSTDKLETRFAMIERQRLPPRPIAVTGLAAAPRFLSGSVGIAVTRLARRV